MVLERPRLVATAASKRFSLLSTLTCLLGVCALPSLGDLD